MRPRDLDNMELELHVGLRQYKVELATGREGGRTK